MIGFRCGFIPGVALLAEHWQPANPCQHRCADPGMRLRRSRAIVPMVSALFVILATAACDNERSVSERAAAPAIPEWRLDSAPQYELGGPTAPPAETWTNFGAIARYDSGTLIIGDTYTGEIRFFDRTGNHVQTLGRRGDGPGEFREMWGVYLGPGDTVWGVNNPTGMIYGFKNGKYERSMRVPRIGLSGLLGTRPVGLARKPATGPTGASGEPLYQPGLIRSAAYLIVQDGLGNDVDTLAEVPASESYISKAGNLHRPLLGRNSYIAVGRDFVAKGDGADTVVVVFDEHGDTLGTVPVSEITGDAFRTLVEARRVSRLAEGRSESEVATISAMLDEMPLADRITDISALVAATDGNIWICSVFLPQDSIAEWRIFSISGSPVARVRIPVRYRLRHVSKDEVVVSYRDDTDVPRVAMFRILK